MPSGCLLKRNEAAAPLPIRWRGGSAFHFYHTHMFLLSAMNAEVLPSVHYAMANSSPTGQ